jgi:hypothetical protein
MAGYKKYSISQLERAEGEAVLGYYLYSVFFFYYQGAKTLLLHLLTYPTAGRVLLFLIRKQLMVYSRIFNMPML